MVPVTSVNVWWSPNGISPRHTNFLLNLGLARMDDLIIEVPTAMEHYPIPRKKGEISAWQSPYFPAPILTGRLQEGQGSVESFSLGFLQLPEIKLNKAVVIPVPFSMVTQLIPNFTAIARMPLGLPLETIEKGSTSNSQFVRVTIHGGGRS